MSSLLLIGINRISSLNNQCRKTLQMLQSVLNKSIYLETIFIQRCPTKRSWLVYKLNVTIDHFEMMRFDSSGASITILDWLICDPSHYHEIRRQHFVMLQPTPMRLHRLHKLFAILSDIGISD